MWNYNSIVNELSAYDHQGGPTQPNPPRKSRFYNPIQPIWTNTFSCEKTVTSNFEQWSPMLKGTTETSESWVVFFCLLKNNPFF